MSGWRVSVDPRVCTGAGICVGTAPRHFALADGRSRPLRELVDPERDTVVVDAAESCPVEAITVRDATDGTVISPEP